MPSQLSAGLKQNLKAAFTQIPFCIPTYVAIIGISWLILAKWF
jgi:hypothetical protein